MGIGVIPAYIPSNAKNKDELLKQSRDLCIKWCNNWTQDSSTYNLSDTPKNIEELETGDIVQLVDGNYIRYGIITQPLDQSGIIKIKYFNGNGYKPSEGEFNEIYSGYAIRDNRPYDWLNTQHKALKAINKGQEGYLLACKKCAHDELKNHDSKWAGAKWFGFHLLPIITHLACVVLGAGGKKFLEVFGKAFKNWWTTDRMTAATPLVGSAPPPSLTQRMKTVCTAQFGNIWNDKLKRWFFIGAVIMVLIVLIVLIAFFIAYYSGYKPKANQIKHYQDR
jgi:hypothetical protein